MGLKIRDALPSERAEAVRQWVASFCPGAGRISIGSPARTLRPWLWTKMHRAWVELTMAESDCHVLVAVLEERPHEPLGWICWTDERVDDGRDIPSAIHYVYVVDGARRHGLGTRLLAKAPRGSVTTHETASGTALLTSMHPPKAAHA